MRDHDRPRRLPGPLTAILALSLAVAIATSPSVSVAAQSPATAAKKPAPPLQKGNQDVFLSVGADKTDADGTTPLQKAVRAGDKAKVDQLLRAKADVNAANRYGVTALSLAAVNGDAVMTDALLKAGADPNAAQGQGQTVLMTAARTGNPDVLKLLIAKGANVNAKEGWEGETALMWAAAENHGEAVKVLAAAGADLNAHNGLTEFPEQKFTTSGMVTTYLNRGAWTPLMYAARQDSVDAAKALIAAGADLNQVDDDGANALVLAIINAHFETANLLIDAGANPNVVDKTGMGALYAAVDLHSLDVMFSRPMPRFDKDAVVRLAETLVAHGANVNQQLKTAVLERHHNAGNQQMGEGTTPIIRAAKNGDTEMMKVLLDHGARLDLTLKDHSNALMIAIASGAGTYGRSSGTESGAIAAVRLCIERGVNVNAAKDNGQTALHAAAGAGGDAVIKILAEHGATLDLKDKQGLTALDIASGRGGGGGRRGGGGNNNNGGGGAGPGQPRTTTVALLRQLMGLPPADAPAAQQ